MSPEQSILVVSVLHRDASRSDAYMTEGRKSAVVGSQQESCIPASIEKEKSFKVSFFCHVD